MYSFISTGDGGTAGIGTGPMAAGNSYSLNLVNEPTFATELSETIMPFGGLYKGLWISGGDGPTSVTVFKNGSSTTVAATLPALGGDAADTLNSFSFNAGDKLSLVIGGSGTLDYAVSEINGVPYSSSYYGGGTNAVVRNTGAFPDIRSNPYIAICGYADQAPSTAQSARSNVESDVSAVMPVSGYISRFYVNMMYEQMQLASGGNASNAFTYTIMKNGLATALTCTISGLDTSASVVSTVTFSAGDTLSIMAEVNPGYVFPINNPGAQLVGIADWTLDLHSTVNGEMITTANHYSLPSVARRGAMHKSRNWNTTSNSRELMMIPYEDSNPWRIKKLMVSGITAPGVGRSRQFRSTFSATPSVTISDLATSGTWTGDVSYNNAFVEREELISNVTNSPAASTNSKFGFVFFRQPKSTTGFFDFFESSGGNKRGLCN